MTIQQLKDVIGMAEVEFISLMLSFKPEERPAAAEVLNYISVYQERIHWLDPHQHGKKYHFYSLKIKIILKFIKN